MTFFELKNELSYLTLFLKPFLFVSSWRSHRIEKIWSLINWGDFSWAIEYPSPVCLILLPNLGLNFISNVNLSSTEPYQMTYVWLEINFLAIRVLLSKCPKLILLDWGQKSHVKQNHHFKRCIKLLLLRLLPNIKIGFI